MAPFLDLTGFALTTNLEQEFASLLAQAVQEETLAEGQAGRILSAYLSDHFLSEIHLVGLPSALRDSLSSAGRAHHFRVGVMWRGEHPRVSGTIPMGTISMASIPPDFSVLDSAPAWSDKSVFKHHAVEPYLQLFDSIRRNERLLEHYLAHLPAGSVLLSQHQLLTRLHLKNIEAALELHAYPNSAYLVDIQDRTILLQQLIMDLGRQLGALLEEPGSKPKPTLPRRRLTPRLAPRAKPKADAPRFFPQLINHAYPGLLLTLRPYQVEALQAFEKDLVRARHLAVEADDRKGTIVLPTGSGKTRLMSATMAVLFKNGSYQLGDKIIITTHLKTITAQNLEAIVRDLGPDFEKHFGRSIKVTTVAGGEEDYSGDVLILSIPKVGKTGYELSAKLRAALPATSRIPFLVMDEVHHDGAKSWQAVAAIIRSLSEEVYVLGLTATPLGDEANVFFKRPPYEMIKDGVLPSTYLVEKKTGLHLDGIRCSGGDFNQRELEDVVNTYARNKIILQSLEEFAFRVEGNDRALAPTMISAVDRKHAFDIAKLYVEYFANTYKQAEFKLRGRKIALAGVVETGGKLKPQSRAELENILEQKKRGNIDAIVVVLTGDMSDSARQLVYEQWRLGGIESVISAKVLAEGFDGWFVQNLVGARATLSLPEKTQEVGRITRRGSDEFSATTGIILKERPRIAIDLIDIFAKHGAPLQTYRVAFGYLHKTIPPDKIWDLVNEVELGTTQPRPNGNGTPQPPKPKGTDDNTDDEEGETLTEPELIWNQTREHLLEILTEHYHGDVAEMAYYLGLDEEELDNLLMGTTPMEGRINLARRLATLLYLDRDSFIRSYLKDLEELPGTEHDRYKAIEAIRWGLEVYLKTEGLDERSNLKFDVDMGVESEELEVRPHALRTLYQDQWLDVSYRSLVQGLMDYFAQARPEIRNALITGMNAVYGTRLNWDKRLTALADLSLKDMENYREVVQETKPDVFYLVGSSKNTIKKNGKISGTLSLADAAPETGSWIPSVGIDSQGKVVKDSVTGSYAKLLLNQLIESSLVTAPAGWVKKGPLARRLAELKNLADLKGLKEEMGGDFLDTLARELFGDQRPEIIYLVGSNQNTIKKNGRISGTLSLADSAPATGNKIASVGIDSQGQVIKDSVTGSYAKLLLDHLIKAGLVTAPAGWVRKGPKGPLERRLAELKNLADLKGLKTAMGRDFLDRLARELFGEKRPEIIYLVGSSRGTILKNGKIVGTLSLVDSVPEAGSWIASVGIDQQGQVVKASVTGKNAKLLLNQLIESGLVTAPARWVKKGPLERRLAELKNLAELKGLKEEIGGDFLDTLARELFGDQRPPIIYLVGSHANTIQKNGRISGTLSLVDSAPEAGIWIPSVGIDSQGQVVKGSVTGVNAKLLLAKLIELDLVKDVAPELSRKFSATGGGGKIVSPAPDFASVIPESKLVQNHTLPTKASPQILQSPPLSLASFTSVSKRRAAGSGLKGRGELEKDQPVAKSITATALRLIPTSHRLAPQTSRHHVSRARLRIRQPRLFGR